MPILDHHERLNLIGALCVSPRKPKIKLHLQSYRNSISGEQVVRFLVHLLRHITGPVVMVWDKHPIHRRGKVKEFLARHPRMHVYEFPTSAPELNPTEFVWTQISEYTASTAPMMALSCGPMGSLASLARAVHQVGSGRVSSPLFFDRVVRFLIMTTPF